jgi:hypothetical protein
VTRGAKDLRNAPGLSDAASRSKGFFRVENLADRAHATLAQMGTQESCSIKRVASAVGEGAMAVHFVHEYLASR